MKHLLGLIVAILVAGTLSCQKETSVLEPQKTVDYKLIDSLLSAKGRYWVIEKITRISDKETLEYISDNGFKTDSLLGVLWHGGYIAGANFKSYDGKILQQDGGGVYGPLPYTTNGKLYVYHMSSRQSSYGWTEDHSKVFVQLPDMLRNILQHISKVKIENFEGYLDPASYPVYGNVEGIKAAEKSERIKIVKEIKTNDKTDAYVFTLRAVWLDSNGSGGGRVSLYDKVVY